MSALAIVAVLAGLAATILADLRWLLVAQREHYLTGSATRFALRWWRTGPNLVLAVAAVLGVVLSPLTPTAGIVGALAVGSGPFGFPLRPRSPGPLVWTTRLGTVAAVTLGAQILVVIVAVLVGGGVPVAGLVALLSPLTVDGALGALSPLEDRRAERFVAQARERLGTVAPDVVAITGSYGKTTTKRYAAHLMTGSKRVVPSPASYNNRAGLSRAVNEQLVPGTDVFIAEMGTYRRGEIAELVEWCHPRVAAITAIGPVHLERFGTEDEIVRAKAEILEGAEIAVLNVDDPRLASLAGVLKAAGRTVIRCASVDQSADVVAVQEGERLVLRRSAETVGEVPLPDAPLGNVAVAAALAFAVGVPVDAVRAALGSLPSVPNRRTLTTLSTGAVAIDDTFNSNPAGCRAALATLTRHATADGRRVVVTPGMVELGPVQAAENRAWSALAARAATHLVLVGATNRRALLAGLEDVPETDRAVLVLVGRHDQAVAWVRAHTGPGDIVLYENQLPDHYP
jgi:UDP-N-acetylmuramoyl-tripeptide--D-alanyl-D-alanine ligase